MSKPAPQSLSDLLEGKEPPPSDDPINLLPIPSYRRDGLYGRTPFRPREAPRIVAIVIDQQCSQCGTSRLYLEGVYREVQGTSLTGEARFMNLIDDPPMEEVDEVRRETEKVRYCPDCIKAKE